MKDFGGSFELVAGTHYKIRTSLGVFNVSVDYIIGEGVLSQYDKEVLKRIDDIEKLDDETKNKMFFLIDNIIQNFKTKQAFAK